MLFSTRTISINSISFLIKSIILVAAQYRSCSCVFCSLMVLKYRIFVTTPPKRDHNISFLFTAIHNTSYFLNIRNHVVRVTQPSSFLALINFNSGNIHRSLCCLFTLKLNFKENLKCIFQLVQAIGTKSDPL